MKTFEHLKANFESFYRAEADSVINFDSLIRPSIEDRLSFVEWRLINTADFMIQIYHYIASQQKEESK